MRVSILIVCLLLSGCAGCEESVAEVPASGEATEQRAATDTVPEVDDEAARVAEAEHPARPERPRTSAARAARARAMPADERARLRERSEHLARGRQLGRAGDHEGALAAFQAALVVAPHDVTVQCEAGYQALQLERYIVAETHLQMAIERAASPRTLAMCRYNLGRVEEAQDRLQEAERHYQVSVELRPNRIVQARLDEVTGRLDDEERYEAEEEELEEEGVDMGRVAGRHFPTLGALASAAGCGGWPAEDPPAVPSPSPALREVGLYDCEDRDVRSWLTLLCVRSDEGWFFVREVAQTDMGDSYGRLEASETAEIRYDGPRVLVLVTGGYDEPEGEADVYWECEREHPDDDEAQQACFDDGTEGMTAQHWSRGSSFVLDGDELVEDPNPPDFEPLLEAAASGE